MQPDPHVPNPTTVPWPESSSEPTADHRLEHSAGGLRLRLRLRRQRQRLRWNSWRPHDAGMATAEYAIATLAACGFAALLLAILRSGEVRDLLLGIIRRALAVN